MVHFPIICRYCDTEFDSGVSFEATEEMILAHTLFRHPTHAED